MHYQTNSSSSWSNNSYMSQKTNITNVTNNPFQHIQKIASQNPVVIFTLSSCYMCLSMQRLFCGMGVNPMVYDLDEDPIRGQEMEIALMGVLGKSCSTSIVPVVFIGGKLVGGMDRVMASHINGSLVPLLKQVGALWL